LDPKLLPVFPACLFNIETAQREQANSTCEALGDALHDSWRGAARDKEACLILWAIGKHSQFEEQFRFLLRFVNDYYSFQAIKDSEVAVLKLRASDECMKIEVILG
jgi:hypothetical protein